MRLDAWSPAFRRFGKRGKISHARPRRLRGRVNAELQTVFGCDSSRAMRWRRKARRGVVLAWSGAFRRQFAARIWQSYFQLAEHDEGEHQIVAAMDGQRMDVPEQLCRCRCHSPVNRFSRLGVVRHPPLPWGASGIRVQSHPALGGCCGSRTRFA